MKLIDKDALVEKIKEWTNLLMNEINQKGASQIDKLSLGGRIAELQEVKAFIDNLEVKEEVLDEEGKTKLMKKCVHKAYKRGYDMGVLKTINEMNHNIKEVDLEKEFDLFLDNIEGVPRMWHSDEQIEWAKDIARHFFELGLKAQKGE